MQVQGDDGTGPVRGMHVSLCTVYKVPRASHIAGVVPAREAYS